MLKLASIFFIYFISVELLTVSSEIIIIAGFIILIIKIKEVLSLPLNQGLTMYSTNIYNKLKEQFRNILAKNHDVPENLFDKIQILTVQTISIINHFIKNNDQTN